MKAPTLPRLTLAAAATLVLCMSVAAVRARADLWDKKTILSVNQPIQIEETYLEPGTYVLKLHNSPSNRNIVHIYNRDENHLINTVMAVPNYRLQPEGDSRFTFYETPQGSARAMRAWFYPGDSFGQEFRYPKQLRQIAMVTQPELRQRMPEPAPAPEVSEPEPQPEPQALNDEPAREEPVVIAQNEPQPQPPRDEPAPSPAQPAPQPRPEESPLPATGTQYPMLGLAGLAALGAYGVLRTRNRLHPARDLDRARK